jgi:hypothetical protein
MNTLVYVDRPLAIAIAAKLVGVLQTQTEGSSKTASFNWLVSAGVGAQNTSAKASDVRELLPEDLVHFLYPHISERHSSIEPIIGKFSAGTGDAFVPGTVVSVQGRLSFPDLDGLSEAYSPYKHTDVKIPEVMFHGETCIVGKLESGAFMIPVFFSETSKYQVAFCNNEPVEITGVLRWTPPYSPKGGRALNMAIRCAALWLQ